ncbi:uncharacterized protein LOC124956179 [Vespa velutina]|uniref:uncharacterized protein LOC124956179 n=1 Tax=Vespa velutina TaxID=202808 RepID=UPI001FB43147|nr:uncharacterized protein LOC124956179 [Vespa velutina]
MKKLETINLPPTNSTEIYLNYINGLCNISDNWYTNTNLVEKLIPCNTHLVETIRKNRKRISVEVKLKKLKQNKLIAMQNRKGIMVLKWKDRRDILIISTKHLAETVTVCKNNYTREKLTVVLDSNIGKCAVDLTDQMIGYSTPHRKTVMRIELSMHLT